MESNTTLFSNEVNLFKALSDENRLQILYLLKSGELCACKLLEKLNINQSTLSHHMKILCDVSLVIPRREGKWTHYSLNASGCKNAQDLLKEITACPASILANTSGGCSCRQ